MKTLVTGGVRSGKSGLAEAALTGRDNVTYVACGPTLADPDWVRRIHEHRVRRPEDWATIESADLDAVIPELSGPALIDCLGTWLTAHLDRAGAWDVPTDAWKPTLDRAVDSLVQQWQACPHDLVAVSNEVGWGVVPEHRSGRIFADYLGVVNQRIAAASDHVTLAVAGLPVTVK